MSSVAAKPAAKLAFHTLAALALVSCAAIPTPLPGQTREGASAEIPPDQAPTYVDLVELAESASLVALVTIDDQIVIPPERAPGLPAGEIRLYLESLTQSLLSGPSGIGSELTFLADLPATADGKAPKIKKQTFLIFADFVPGQPGAVQLVSPRAMLPAGPVIEQRVRRVLTQLAAGDAPPAVTGIRDVIWVEGNLAGESETQMFVETSTGAPVSLSVIRRPGMAPQWGASLGEIVDQSARAPEPQTLAWYRFACGLPASLPRGAFLQTDAESRRQAERDYAFIRDQLGACERRF